jgi:hypothetical protein
MKNGILKFFALLLLISCFSAGRSSKKAAQSDAINNDKTPITGVWKAEQFALRYPDSAWTVIKQQNESLYVFANKFYSYSYVRGSQPRSLFAGDPNKPSDAEKVGAYDSFVANAGTYVLNDSTLTLTAKITKNPNEMVGRSLTYTIRMEDNKLEMTITDPPFFPGRQWKTSLIRIE